MDHFEDEYDDRIIIDTICVGCDMFKFITDYPCDFGVWQDNDKKGL